MRSIIHNHLSIIIWVLVLLNTLLIVQTIKSKKNAHILQRELLNNRKSLQRLESCYDSKMLEITLENESFDYNQFRDGVTKRIGTVLRETDMENYTFLRLSEFNCKTCVDSLIFELNKSLSINNCYKIILLLTYKSDDYYHNFIRFNKPICDVIRIEEGFNSSVLESAGVPYFFQISKEKYINVFVPCASIPDITSAYIQKQTNKHSGGLSTAAK